jgi:thioredoxin 1
MMAPMFGELAAETAGHVQVTKLNVDENPVTAGWFNVRSIPTLLALKKGLGVDRIVGVQSKSDIARRLQQVIA